MGLSLCSKTDSIIFWLIISILFMKEKGSLCATGEFLEMPNSLEHSARSPVLCLRYWANPTDCGVLFNVQAEKVHSEVGHFLVSPASPEHCSYFSCLKALSRIPKSPEVNHGSGCEPAELAYLRTVEKTLGHSSPSLLRTRVVREYSRILLGVQIHLSCDSNLKCKDN